MIILMNSSMRVINLLIVLSLIPLVSIAQITVEPQVISQDSEEARAEVVNPDAEAAEALLALEDAHLEFIEAQDVFYTDQTTFNKDAFDEAAIIWAEDLLQDQLSYIAMVEAYLFSVLATQAGIEAHWLSEEAAAITVQLEEVSSLTTYAEVRAVIAENVDTWEQIRAKIQQMRVYQVYSEFALGVEIARALHDQFLREQETLEQAVVNTGDDPLATWQPIFDTYAEKLFELEASIADKQGELADPRAWTTLDSEDELWIDEQDALLALQDDMEVLQTLQTEALESFVTIVDSLVVPAAQLQRE